MNRILFEKSEISGGIAVFGGARAAHVANVLRAEAGDTIKTGEIDGKVGTSEIVEVSPDRVVARVAHDGESVRPWADLILAPPRPRAFKRLLPQLIAMGVGRIVLIGAQKVEKDFWGATILKEENWRPVAVDALMQSGATAMPRIELRRNFRKFAQEELDAMFPHGARIVAHPGGEGAWNVAWRLAEEAPRAAARLLFAIGPEGGWTEEEVAMLEGRGFARVSLGPRILKTETAAVALLAAYLSLA